MGLPNDSHNTPRKTLKLTLKKKKPINIEPFTTKQSKSTRTLCAASFLENDVGLIIKLGDVLEPFELNVGNGELIWFREDGKQEAGKHLEGVSWSH
ncbi:MAG: hypothetical protein Salg2KO_23310 [Salibacteraceae bacterium]